MSSDSNLSEICRRYRILGFDSNHRYFLLTKMYKVYILNKHEYFVHKLNSMMNDHNHGTRWNANECLGIPQYSRTKCQNSFLFRGIKYWNGLNLEIRF